MVRSFAKKVLGRILGGEPKPPASAPAPHSPSRPAAPPPAEPVADAEALTRLEAGVQEVKERVEAGEPVVMLDVRQPEETAGGVIPGAILIPLPELEARWLEVKDKNEIICYCAGGMRSLKAAKLLREKGVFNSTSLEGGINAWKAQGGRVVPRP